MFLAQGLNLLKLPALFNLSPNAYVLLDRDNRIVGMNQAYLDVTRRSAEALLGQGLFDAFPSDPASLPGRLLRQSLDRVLLTNRTDHLSSVHYPIAGPDGQVHDRYWSATHVPVPGADGQVDLVLQHTVDVTELVQLRAQAGAVEPVMAAGVLHRANWLQAHNLALGEELAWLRLLFDQAPGFMAVMRGPSHVFEFANRACVQLLGERPLLDRPVREALPELHDQAFFGLLDEAYRSGQAYTTQAMPAQLQRQPDGPRELRHVDFVFQPLKDASGQVHAIFVQGHDVTEAQRSRQAALDSELRFRTLAQSLPNQVWTAKANGALDWCNQQVRHYTGLADAELAGRGWASTVHADDIGPTDTAWRQALRNGKAYEVEFRVRRHDGRYRWHLLKALPIRDDRGDLTQWIGTNTDIEDQKASVLLLADLNNQLAQRVEQRTAELMRMQDALRQSQKMEAIGNLAGGIAHDFNNLLQVVGGNLALLAQQLPAPGKAELHIRAAQDGVARGARLAAQLLAFGRRQALAPEVLHVGRLVQDMAQILQGSVGEQISIQSRIADGLWPTQVDRGNLENALLNLALNARDAMSGQGRLSIEVSNAALDGSDDGAHGEHVVLAVSDSGAGMSEQVAAQAFEPFFTTKPEGKGTGLGLSMVYGFVKQSGGVVRLHSAPGQGTTVRLYLPRCTDAPAAALPDTPTAPVSATGGNELVLVVEDDAAVRETTVALLQGLGYAVRQAGDAQSAWTMIEAGLRVDLLFTDVVMPGPLSSTTLAQKARKQLPQMAVLFTSGYAQHSIVHGGRLDPGVHLLAKPYGRDALASKLRQVLARRPDAAPPQAGQASAAAAAPPAPPPRVLVCEDDAGVREALIELLALLGFEPLAAASAAAARAVLAEQAIDLLITDLGLPDEDGLSLARWALQRQPGLGLVLATGSDIGSAAAASLPAAARLLRKPFDLDQLATIWAPWAP